MHTLLQGSICKHSTSDSQQGRIRGVSTPKQGRGKGDTPQQGPTAQTLPSSLVGTNMRFIRV